MFNGNEFRNLQEMKIQKAPSVIEIASDSNFSNQTTNFSKGQNIYVKIESNVSGDDKKTLNLRDNEFKLISTYNLTRSGNSPYQFTTNLQAPSNSGNFSLEAQIVTQGSQVNLVKTINVEGESSSTSQTKVEVNVNSNSTTGEVLSEKSDSQDKNTDMSPSPNSDQQSEQTTSISEQDQTLVSIVIKVVTSFVKLFF